MNWCAWFFQPRFEEQPDRPVLREAVKIYRNPLVKCIDEWCNARLLWLCMMLICLAGIGVGCWMCSLDKKYIYGGVFTILFSLFSLSVSCFCFRSVRIKRRYVTDVGFDDPHFQNI